MTITIDLTAEKYARLIAIAEKSEIPIEELVSQQIDTLLDRENAIDAATKYVLAKNAELYRRLAK